MDAPSARLPLPRPSSPSAGDAAPPSSRRLTWVAVAHVAIVQVGCAAAPARPQATPAAHSQSAARPLDLLPPVEMLADRGPDNDGVVRVVGTVSCTGTLIAEDLVLTAHHCVSQRDADGRALSRDIEAEDISVELGGDYLPWGEVGVRAVVSPDCGYRMGHGDIALLVLSRKLVGIPTATARLESPPSRGEGVVPVGFGRCSTSPDGIRRVVRAGGPVDSVQDSQFVGAAAICPGDSGAPTFNEQDEVVGVVSASVMDGDDRTLGATVYTRLDAWRTLFSAAKEIAAGTSASELPPFRACF